MQKVILVDENDNPIGEMERLLAHERGVLHRAFSVFVFNEDGTKILLQQRAFDKYHSAGLWTNACCSHQLPELSNLDSIQRRLMEELGLTLNVSPLFTFIYKAPFENGLIEHELDHVFVGKLDERTPIPFNPEEVHQVKWVDIKEFQEAGYLKSDFTYWFNLVIQRVISEYLGV